jgi:hypothetical protein
MKIESLEQMEILLSWPALATGRGWTVTSILAEAEHPSESVTSKVYVVVAVAVAIGFGTLELLIPVVGVHEYINPRPEPPLADGLPPSLTDCP